MTDTPFDAGRYFLDLGYQYAEDVRTGKKVAGKLEKHAVDRWFRDLELAGERGFVFDENAAAKNFRFIYKYCKHYIGEWEGKPVQLEPWQCFINMNVFGWVSKETGYRRFRNVYEEVARKNGKTTKLSSNGAYLVAGDHEPGAKVYCAATKKEQAEELFTSISVMAEQDKTLMRAMDAQKNLIHCHTNNSPRSMVRILSKDYKTMDGLNVHGALIDELHAHPDSGIWDVLESARGARRQPLMWGITTAGFDHNGFCYEMRSYAVKILEQSIAPENCDSFFAIIFALDEEDDWEDPKNWIKANPNLGVSVDLHDMTLQFQKAREVPTAKMEFLTKRLNKWVYGQTAWMNMDKWNACQLDSFDESAIWDEERSCELDGMAAHGGLDLASREDLTSLTFQIPLENGKTRVISRSYMPEFAFEKRMKMGGHIKAIYQRARDAGHLIVTPGVVCDYSFIKSDVLQICSRLNVLAIAYDRWNSSQLVTELLDEGAPMVAMGQGFGSISPAMKELLVMVLDERIQHNNSLLTFAVSNLVAVANPAGDIKFDKSKVSEKIDPAAAMIMAVGVGMTAEDEEQALNDFLDNPIVL